MLLGQRSTIAIVPGVTPEEDSTALDTLYFTDSDRIRFQNGKLRQIGGWTRVFFDNFQTITGSARNIFSYHDIDGNPITIVGTNTRLYSIINDSLFNITPLQIATNALPNSLATEYNASVGIDVVTIAGSSVVTLTFNHFLNMNDQVQISGVTGGPYNGIPASAFNTTFSAYVANQSSIEINTGNVATSSGTVVVNMTWAASYLFVTDTAHLLSKGDRIGILGSTDVDGIPSADINIENYITNIVDPNTFVIQTNAIATSKVTAGGGAGITIKLPIAPGNTDQSSGFGYGGGFYGAGLYGTPKAFTNYEVRDSKPRIWSMDTFGGYLILTPGDPATDSTDNLYIWKSDVTIGPTLLSAEAGALEVPLAIKWVYVSNSIVITYGAGGVLNQYTSSNSGSFNFTIGPSTLAFNTTIEQSGALISQASCRNRDLIFTENDVYLAEFVEAPFIWLIRKLFTTDGLIGPKARVEIEDAVFWMGKGDFYVFDGTSVNVLPNNTVKRFVYDSIDFSQSYKCFAYPNVAFQEISWYFVQKNGQNPVGNDPVTYVTYNYKEQHWVKGTMPRTAAEEPINIEETPLTVQTNINGDNYLFQQENGLNDYNVAYNPLTDSTEEQYSPINAFATTNFAQINEGNNTMMIYSIFPDTFQAQNLSLSVFGKLYAQGDVIPARGNPYIITPATTKMDIMLVARQRQYVIESVGTNSNFLIGKWIEEAKESSAR